MAPLPPLTPTPPESTGARIRARTRSEASEETIWQSDAALIFVKLRKMIASDTQPTETILGAIAVAAHALTGGTGAAVAMPRDGVVVCVGRSGETAPELGDRLNVDSGISGECLRTGVIMRCDDASRDFHVDAEVCRELGLQSIAVVPLRGQYGRVGVLEAFSTESYAFTEDKMEILGRLAGLAEAAWARGAVTEDASREESQPTIEVAAVIPALVEIPQETPPASSPPVTPAITPSLPDPVPLERVREVFAQPEASGGRRKWRYAAIGAVALLALALLSVYGWKEWYKASVTSRSTQTADSSQNSSPEGGTTDAEAGVRKPSATGSAARPGQSPLSRTLTSSPTGTTNAARRQPRRAADGSDAGNAIQPKSASNTDEPPPLEASSASQSDLGEALTPAPALPKLGVPVSQGIAGGVLIRKVQPVYPAEARRMHVEGNVVIDAVVTVQGQIDELQLVSGDPRLAPAAIEAVRKWQYTPYSLNGQPIPKQTRITISFIAPQ